MLKKKRFRYAKIPKGITFLSKLYDILNDKQCKDIIHWNNEGNAIFIVDISKLCEIVLPRYYKHTNYSSFVRQLNIYGFNKIKGQIKEELIFEHGKFNKNCTKEQIKEISQEKRKLKLDMNYINYSQLSNDLKITDSNIQNYKNIFQILLNKYEENKHDINELKKEIKHLKQINNSLITKIRFFKEKLYGHSILLLKILLNKNGTISCNKTKSKDLKELLKKYLYYLHIYSPYVTIKGVRTEKVHSFKIGSLNMNNNKIEIYNHNINIENINNINYNYTESIDDLSFIREK